ncbi:PQQ-binding-like beta-propeller repeat protein [Altericroceibacterium endophyticum]|uniref:PQQ-binding-like beta-propeller repeat protein n=1 Tax=Altericroceibacterium endophyticum TaxID=1808508 RepID=A0A6I4T9W3_9SPHN|nr:PQQ-binding-like beta-propeller repeat protein [Altericroceibacterium endophyticum]MXO66660.1 PQQ-binding-like beta-propeller repeat protein [Altericroceibacterium endophyticum]
MRFRSAILASALATMALAPATQLLAEDPAPGDWPRYTRDLGGTRFSPLTQINRDNVDQLEVAWRFQVRPEGGGSIVTSATPIVIDDVLFLPIGNAVVALDGDSGKELWRHDTGGGLARRTVSYWPGDDELAARIYYSTGDEIVALDAASGKLATDFADQGVLKLDIPYRGPPTVFRNVLIIGANVNEMPVGPSGNSRAFDARTGAKIWEFNTVPQPGEPGHETWGGDGWKGRSGTNVWIWYMTVDEETGMIYMPVGSPSPNYYGGDRPGDNLYGNSLVAVDAESGEYKWHFQTIHHDLWDKDLPAPPVLIDIEKDGKIIPALAETGKTAYMYILNRETGEPIFGVDEVPVAAGNVPGEYYSPTQPIPVKPPRLSQSYWSPDKIVTAQQTSQQHVDACHALLDEYGGTFYNTGPFTPFMLHEEGGPVLASIDLPINGGSNWGGSAADPNTGYVFVNSSEGGTIGFVEKRKEGGDYGRGAGGSTQEYDRASLSGPGAYSHFAADYIDADGNSIELPCTPQPWGRLFAIDANTGEIAWESVLGTTDALPEGQQKTGRTNFFGGPIVTAGGLVFIGGTDDQRFRAFDSQNGEELWSTRLEYNAQAVPITYEGRDGRQYVAVVAANFGASPRGPDGKPLNNESLMVFALPE